jgi:hypothetical protein
MQVQCEISRNDSDAIRAAVVTVEIDEDGQLRIDGYRVLGTVSTPAGNGWHTEHGHWYAVAPEDLVRIYATLGPEAERRDRAAGPVTRLVEVQLLFTASIGHILSGATRPHKTHGSFIYIIRDDDQVLYVGQTTIAVHKRLNQHIKQGASVFGAHFREHVPAAYAWQVEILEVTGNLDTAEREQIQLHRPLLNIRMNQE